MSAVGRFSRLFVTAIGAAVPAAALAQSELTLYGIVDVGIQWNRQYAPASAAQRSAWSVESGYQSGSRFGLRGAEALGGGLSAVFTLEGGFDTSTGQSTQGGLLFGRQAWAGLQGSWGTLVAGRIATPSSGTGSFDMFAAVDPFGAGFGINQIGSTFAAANALREDNAVLYVSPLWGGVKAAAGYSFNRVGDETAPQGTNVGAFTTGLSFASGPFYAVVTYDAIDFPDPGTARPEAGFPTEKLLQIGATWDFKVVKLYGAYAHQSNVSAVRGLVSVALPAGVNAYSNQAWMIGLSVPVLGGSLLGSYQSAHGDSTNYLGPSGPAVFEPDCSVWGIGFAYPVSRRTNLYAGYGQADAGGTLSATTTDRKQFGAGLRHRF